MQFVRTIKGNIPLDISPTQLSKPVIQGFFRPGNRPGVVRVSWSEALSQCFQTSLLSAADLLLVAQA